jgi:hypothetical protein
VADSPQVKLGSEVEMGDFKPHHKPG